jgi:cytochrome c oxidase subunit 2
MKSRTWTLLIATLILIAAVILFLPGSILAPKEEVIPTGVIKEFTITAKQWEFTSTIIEADLGDTVKIEIQGLDDGTGGGHGFFLSAFNLNKVIRKDDSVVVEFFAEKSGSFTFSCNVPCGSGHTDMKGTLKVG